MTQRLFSAEFEQFVARHFGAGGRAWLDGLPERIERYRRQWRLQIGAFLPGGLLACCLAATTSEAEAAVLKLCGPWAPAGQEGLALQAWAGGPAPRLLRLDAAGNALLLERISPADHFTFKGEGGSEADQLAKLLITLHAPPPSIQLTRALPPLADVVEKRISTAGVEAAARSSLEAAQLLPRLELARARAHTLLAHPMTPALLHGDLENKNILHCGKRSLVAIDPLPCIGEAAYDAGYWLASAVAAESRDAIAHTLGHALQLDPVRLRAWASTVALEP